MKIISKYKDYYDYLVGAKYGIDNKIVLDRTKFNHIALPPKHSKITIFFCGYKIEGICLEDRVLYGRELIEHFEERKSKHKSKYSRFMNSSNDHEYYYIIVPDVYNTGTHIEGILKEPRFLGEKSPNHRYDCPILIYKYGEPGSLDLKDNCIAKFPILKTFSFHKVFPPEDAYLKLYEWLTKENPIVEISDKDKITGHGFDLKTSFRNMK